MLSPSIEHVVQYGPADVARSLSCDLAFASPTPHLFLFVSHAYQRRSHLYLRTHQQIASQQRHYTTHLCSPSTSCTGSPSPSPPPVSPTKLQVTCANCSHVADLDSSLLLDSATANSAAPVEHTNQISTCTIQSEAGPIIVTTIVCAVLTDSDLLVERQQHRLQLRRHCAHIFAKVVVGAFVRPLRRERTLLGRRHPQLGRVYAALVSLDVYVSLWGRSARDDHNSGTIEMDAGANAQMAATESGGPVVVAAEKGTTRHEAVIIDLRKSQPFFLKL